MYDFVVSRVLDECSLHLRIAIFCFSILFWSFTEISLYNMINWKTEVSTSETQRRKYYIFVYDDKYASGTVIAVLRSYALSCIKL